MSIEAGIHPHQPAQTLAGSNVSGIGSRRIEPLQVSVPPPNGKLNPEGSVPGELNPGRSISTRPDPAGSKP